MTSAQLQELGYGRHAIAHRVRVGRLHRKYPGVFAVGNPRLTREGDWMAAVLACGPGAVLSHQSAAALWEMAASDSARTHVSVPAEYDRRPRGLSVHRRLLVPVDVTSREGIPVTTPVRTLVDLAACSQPRRVEIAINVADRLGLVSVDRLRVELDARRGQRGVGVLRRLLDRRTFRLTDSELERRFLRLVREAGLPLPETGVPLNGVTVDFAWPELGLVVETDGLRYHRTPEQQDHDRRRDQEHTAAGLTCLRFTHEQVAREPERVAAILAQTIARLRRGG